MEGIEDIINENLKKLESLKLDFQGSPYIGVPFRFDESGEITELEPIGSNGIFRITNKGIVDISIREGHNYIPIDFSEIKESAKKALKETATKYNTKFNKQY